MLLDGFMVAKSIREDLKMKTDELREQGKAVPTLAVMIVGSDPASKTYVASKEKQCLEVGFNSRVITLDEDVNEDVVLQEISKLNADSEVDGILVQLPLPKHINEDRVIDAIDPLKDVDGLHPTNVGLLEIGRPRFIPCTPKGIMTLLAYYKIELSGKRALVIGRSRLVGKPVTTLLLAQNATVTTAHSKTRNLDQLISEHEIIVVAIGKPEFIKESQLNAKQCVVDVGIHRIEGKIVGDVERAAYDKVAYVTPVPKGIGPMTIASLLQNTFVAYRLNRR